MINLDSKDIMDAKEAAERWDKSEDYVRQIYRKYPDKFPPGTIRKFGKQIVVTREGMEAVVATKEAPRNELDISQREELSKVLESVEEVQKALSAECYLAALTLALTIPDVFAKLETPKRKRRGGIGQYYAKWYNDNIFAYENDGKENTNKIDGNIIYKLRCSIMHGNTDTIDNELSKKYGTTNIKYVLNAGSVSSFNSSYSSNIDEKSYRVSISVPQLCNNICNVATTYCKKHNIVRDTNFDTIKK